MNSIRINNLFFLNYFSFNYMITKINDRKIEHQTNTKTFLKNYDNLIERAKRKKKLLNSILN